jgi:predicted amidohydrolase YtcJ
MHNGGYPNIIEGYSMKGKLSISVNWARFVSFAVFMCSLSACNLTAIQSPNPTIGAPETAIVESESAVPVPELKPGEPHIIFHHGTVLTMEESQSEAQAIALEGDLILAVGSNEEILAMQVPGTKVVDLEGLTLMPGFVDAHSHVLNEEWMSGKTLEEAQQLALIHGITTTGELFTTREFLEEMQAFNATGLLRIRTNLYLVYNTNCGDIVGEWYLDDEDLPMGAEGGMLRADGVKVFSDGGTCNRSPALSFELEPGAGYGDLFVTRDELTQVIERAQAAGFQVAIHAIGDRALDVVMDSLEIAQDGGPNTYRHRIEHNAVIRPDQLPRYQQIDAIATLRGTYSFCDPFGPPLPEPYQSWEWPVNPLLKAYPGGHIAYHSDYPYHRLNPLHHLFGFVTRYDVGKLGQVCPPYDYLADDTISVEQGLTMMTTEAAYALFRDDEVGSLQQGKAADMIILDNDPRLVEPDLIRKIDVLMTMVGGRVEWCTRSYERLCPNYLE